jgi:hypothetical protein
MWDHLQLAYPSLAGWSGGTLGGDDIDDPEAERLAAVIVLRQEIHDHLTITARDLAGDIGLAGPDLATSQRLAVQRAARWLLAQIEPLRAGQGARATEEDLHAAIAWADCADPPGDPHKAIAAAHAGAAEHRVRAVLTEADELAARAHTLAPWRPAPTRLDGIPCRCGAVGTVHDHGDIRKCWRCARNYTDDEWAVLMKVLAHRFRDLEGQTA